jgi:hypothetical protein
VIDVVLFLSYKDKLVSIFKRIIFWCEKSELDAINVYRRVGVYYPLRGEVHSESPKSKPALVTFSLFQLIYFITFSEKAQNFLEKAIPYFDEFV